MKTYLEIPPNLSSDAMFAKKINKAGELDLDWLAFMQSCHKKWRRIRFGDERKISIRSSSYFLHINWQKLSCGEMALFRDILRMCTTRRRDTDFVRCNQVNMIPFWAKLCKWGDCQYRRRPRSQNGERRAVRGQLVGPDMTVQLQNKILSLDCSPQRQR